MVSSCLHSSSPMVSHSTRRPASSTWRSKLWPGSKGWLREDPKSGKSALRYTTQAGEDGASSGKFSVTTSLLISVHLTPQIAILLIYGRVEREINKITCNTKDKLKAMIKAAFTNLNKERVSESLAGDSEVDDWPWWKLRTFE